MDPLAIREDIWRLHDEMKLLHSAQAETAERLSKVERRQEDDARLKSVWGASSPFPGVLSGTPQQDPMSAPVGPDFSTFDESEPNNLLNGLHLDHDEEPRRGASRANSVRFDESAKYGHGTRSSGEYYPTRTGSGMGSHPMNERSSSHKSDGRQSSAGHSVHSTHSVRTNSLGLDTSFPTTLPPGTPIETEAPAPGLMFLGTVPAIIRCWLCTTFSHESLLFAVICTGAADSTIDSRLVHLLGLDDEITRDKAGKSKVKLPVYLPEAVVRKPSSRSNSPAPQLPTITVDFTINRSSVPVGRTKKISIFLGSDTLRAHNADILFSQNSVSMLGDDRSRISIPLVRPEDECLFRCLQTEYASSVVGAPSSVPALGDRSSSSLVTDATTRVSRQITKALPANRSVDEAVQSDSDGRSISSSPSVVKSTSFTIKSEDGTLHHRENAAYGSTPDGKRKSITSISGVPSGRSSLEGIRWNSKSIIDGAAEISQEQKESPSENTPHSGIWNSWRRDSSGSKETREAAGQTISPSTSTSGYQRPIHGRNMKVLRPSKSASTGNATASASRSTSVSFGSISTSRNESEVSNGITHTTTSTSAASVESKAPSSRGQSTLSIQTTAGTAPTGRTSNPVGGASAFAWLKGGGPSKRVGSGTQAPSE